MSNDSMSRRLFMEGTVASGTLLGLGPHSAVAADVSGTPEAGKIGDFKISLAEWSLNRALFAKTIDNLDFPKLAREQYGIEGIEFVNQFFQDKAHDSAYLKDLKKRANDFGVTCVLIMIDGEGDLSEKEKDARTKAVVNHQKWVDAAAALGCHAIRVNTGGHYSPTDVGTIAEACGLLTDYGAKNISIICENHGGPSSNPDALIALMKAVGKPTFGTLPDFGNFPKAEWEIHDRHLRRHRADDAVCQGSVGQELDFNASGMETTLDFARFMKIVSDAGYTDFVGIEYEGEPAERAGRDPGDQEATRGPARSMYQPNA